MSNYHNRVIAILKRLHKDHPTYNIGKHISTAVDDSDLWGVTDKELFLSLQRYEIELNMDVVHEDDDIDDIIKDGMNLERTLFEEEED